MGGFAPSAGNSGLRHLRLRATFWRFLCGHGLAGRLRLGRGNVGATWRNAGLFLRLRLLVARRGCEGAVFFRNQCRHLQFSPFGLVLRSRHGSLRPPEMQLKSARLESIFPLACRAEESVHGPVVNVTERKTTLDG